ncbi:MAG TPA: 50S ribosomal protein L24 [Actinobacteria bacterium]|jgi:large subunit ribosomal protein L24|nr:50S ribosomal protein L24 [Actinomycetota bacterium]
MHVKKGDLVQVIAGRDKGLQGKVIAVFPERDRIVVEGVNRVTRHTKVEQTQFGAKQGGIVNTESTIHVSNVMLVDPETKKPTRVGYRKETVETANGGTKQRSVRISKRTGKDI